MNKLSSKQIAYWAPIIVAALVHFRVLPEFLPPRHWMFIDFCCGVAWWESTYVAELIDTLFGKAAAVALPATAQAPTAPVAKDELDTALERVKGIVTTRKATANAAVADANAADSKLAALVKG